MNKLTCGNISSINGKTIEDEFFENTTSVIDKSDELKELEEEIKCPLSAMVAVFKAIQQGFIYVDLGYGLYEERNINLEYEDISEDEEGYIGFSKSTNYHFILDYDGCIFVEDYKKTWWLKPDRSE